MMEEPSESARKLLPAQYWDPHDPASPFHSEPCRLAFHYFVRWRKDYPIVPTHLALYDFLKLKQYAWGNLRSRNLHDHSYFVERKFTELSEINAVVIAFAFAQLFVEGKIDFALRDACLASIERELAMTDEASKRRSLVFFQGKVESVHVIGIQQTNDQIFEDYFMGKRKE